MESITRSEKHGDAKYINSKRARLYRIWDTMKQRCLNKNRLSFHYYGGRGIKVCKEWLEYKNFKIWALNNGYKDSLEIDRINIDGNYDPNNCRWTTRKVQNRNTRRIQSNNSTGYRGVRKKKNKNIYTAQIKVDYKAIYLGSTRCAIKAAHLYDEYVTSNNLEHTTNFRRVFK